MVSLLRHYRIVRAARRLLVDVCENCHRRFSPIGREHLCPVCEQV